MLSALPSLPSVLSVPSVANPDDSDQTDSADLDHESDPPLWVALHHGEIDAGFVEEVGEAQRACA